MELPNIDQKRVDRKDASEHFERIKQKIVSLWEERVRKSISAAKEKPQLILRQMLSELLDNLVINIAPDSITADFQFAGTIGIEHGTQRANLNDYTLSQVLCEYQILRQVVFEILEEEKFYDSSIRNIILNVIDEGLQKAIEQFSAVRSRELEQSNKDLEHFAAIAAHDLKSPLATIQGYIELLDDDLADKIDHENISYIKTIKRCAAEMTLMIDRLLEYSIIGRKVGVFTSVSTQLVVLKVIENLNSLIKPVQAKIIFKDLPNVNGEASLLLQLFQNLISNAIKFRAENRIPTVNIDVEVRPTYWIFCVKDNGIGFKQNRDENLFTLFKKLHSKKSHHGYGIGLATVRKIVELHGGQVWAESEPGLGSKFFFTLPNANSF
jgi:signal transduction histidine kinase